MILQESLALKVEKFTIFILNHKYRKANIIKGTRQMYFA